MSLECFGVLPFPLRKELPRYVIPACVACSAQVKKHSKSPCEVLEIPVSEKVRQETCGFDVAAPTCVG